MTNTQRIVKYLAVALAVLLIAGIAAGVLGLLGLLGLADRTDGKTEVYTISDTVRSLEMELRAAHVTVTTGDAARIESNLQSLTVKEINGRLVIRQPFRLFMRERGVIRVTLPASTALEEVDISAGAGDVTVDTLTARDMSLELGAGDVLLEDLAVSDNAEIDGGAGTLTVQNSTLHELDLTMGVGELNMTAALTGECELTCGVGEVNLTLTGGQDNYRVEVSRGLGKATVNGVAVKGETVFGSGTNAIEITGGVGTLTVDLE